MAAAYPQSPDETFKYLPKFNDNEWSKDSLHSDRNDEKEKMPQNLVQSETRNELSKEEKDEPPDGLPNTMARVNMPGFMFETKYVMLNFMSLIPPDLYSGHISSSPDSLASSELSASDNLQRSNPLLTTKSHSLSKSQSLDTGLHKSHPKLKHIHKLKHFQQSVDSPASDDNLNYRYRINCERLLSPDSEKSYPRESSSQSIDFVDDYAVDTSRNDNAAAATSPKKRSFYSMVSDVSSSGDFSYVSDADDEYEDNSNASSLFSSRSITCRDGFLDLRKSTPRLSTVRSESEYLDEPDGSPHLERHQLQDVPEEREIAETNALNLEQPLDCGLETQGATRSVADGEPLCLRRQAADRSKLKLDIPCHQVQLSDILVSLQSELNSEMSELETEYEEAVRNARQNMHSGASATPLTPQTEAARVLARIGDEVKAQYGQQIMSAVNKCMVRQAGNMSYKMFKEIAQDVIDTALPGWRQVALLLVFGQCVLWSSIQQGNKQVEDIIEYCSQLVADVAAEFIIKQGGWGSVMNSDPSHSSESFSPTTDDADSPPCVLDYFASHNVTQVESGERMINDNIPGTTGSNLAVGIDALSQLDPNLSTQLAKGRLTSFGFDMGDMVDSNHKMESDQSLDYVNNEGTEGFQDDAVENTSANNSDIFIDVAAENTGDTRNNAGDRNDNCATDDDPDNVLIHMNTDESHSSEAGTVPNTAQYSKDSVYVKQITPTPTKSGLNSDSVVNANQNGNNSRSALGHVEDELKGIDTLSPSLTTDHAVYQYLFETTQESIPEHNNGDIPAKIPNENTDEIEENSPVAKSDASESLDHQAPEAGLADHLLGHFRSMGMKVMVASLVVLAAGVTFKFASLNR